MSLTLRSPSFAHQAEIPTEHTCEGAEVSPALEWSGLPAGAQSLVLIVDDPDAPDPAAPRTTWVHWLLFDLSPDLPGLARALTPAQLPPGAGEGRNDARRPGWAGPCPPIGRHRYFFKLYALDRRLELSQPDRAELERAMHGHVLDQAELIGTYQKKR